MAPAIDFQENCGKTIPQPLAFHEKMWKIYGPSHLISRKLRKINNPAH